MMRQTFVPTGIPGRSTNVLFIKQIFPLSLPLPRSLDDDNTLLNIWDDLDEIWINAFRKDDNVYLNIDGQILNYSNVPVGGTAKSRLRFFFVTIRNLVKEGCKKSEYVRIMIREIWRISNIRMYTDKEIFGPHMSVYFLNIFYYLFLQK